MKLQLFTLMAGMAVLTSCSKDIYNNKSYLAGHNLQGKKLAVLPVEVYYTGSQPKNSDWYAEEQSASLSLQSQLQQAYLNHTISHKPKKEQHQVQLMEVNAVNDRLRTHMADLRTAWTLAPDSVGRMIGADLVLKVRMGRERFMSRGAATGINAGATILEGIVNTSSRNGWLFLPRVNAENIAYEVSLIDARTGELVSSYVNNPEKDHGSNAIESINKKMASKSAVYASVK